MSDLKNRIDLVWLFDVTNGNPNGDPDADGMPRVDNYTGHGLTSDVCLKRKIRNYVEMACAEQPGHRIYVTENSILNEAHREAFFAVRGADDTIAEAEKLSPGSPEEARALSRFMCDNFFDVRTFGAMMATKINCGRITGPVQFATARSIEPITPEAMAMTRMAATTRKDMEAKLNTDDEEEQSEDQRIDNQTMGRKYIVPYGLYRAHGFISVPHAKKTGFSEADLELLLDAIENMFEVDRSSARGEMSLRGFWMFRHDRALGNAPAYSLFDRIQVGRSVNGEYREIDDPCLDSVAPARKFSDYSVRIDQENWPEGVELIQRV